MMNTYCIQFNLYYFQCFLYEKDRTTKIKEFFSGSTNLLVKTESQFTYFVVYKKIVVYTKAVWVSFFKKI